MSHHDLPYQAEYAKSGRSACKACKDNIAADSLRLAVMTQSPHFDGKVPNWFHFACFWKRAKCKNPDDIYNYHGLRWEDQEKIKKKIGGEGAASGQVGEGSSTSREEFAAEYAKSGRSQCRGCESFIAKDSLRLSKKEFESQRAVMYGPQDLWHHVDCFVGKREELEFSSDMDPSQIKGFGKLKPEDKALLISKLGKGKHAGSGHKRKGETKPEAGKVKKAKTEDSDDEKLLREQSKLLWDFRDQLSKDVSLPAMKLMLELNNQEVPSGESKVLDAVADCLAFGVLERCTECKHGQLFYTAEGYTCTGNLTEWTKCMNVTKGPGRRAFKVPKEFHDVPFLKSYKYVKRERAFPQVTVSSKSGLVSSSVDGPSSQPLEGMTFLVAGKLSRSKAMVVKDITELGGTVVSKLDSKVTAVISSKDEVDKKTKVMREAEVKKICVVSDDFLTSCRNGGLSKALTAHSIASWGSTDIQKQLAQRPTKSAPKSGMSAKEEARFTKTVPQTVKMTVKGGAAVDPDSGLAEKAHVLQEHGQPLTAVLGLVDIARGTNSFYKLQALEADNKMSWWVFRAWGRVGTTIGGNKVEKCGSFKSAIRSFHDLYLDKTGNTWQENKHFQKFPNKFYPLEIDYGPGDDEIRKLDMSSSTSSLARSIQDIICMIFDVDSMKKAMMEFEIDMTKMPLGKLSKRQIQSAYSVLSELQKLIDTKGSQNQFVDATNRFYTAVPHDFGMKKPPLLDSSEIIKQKTEMLDNLLEIEVAYSLLKGGDDGQEDPITAHYKKLKCVLEPLDPKSDEFERLKTYTRNTHATTHNMYDLEVLDILTVKRQGEAQMFRPFKDLQNHLLLWHGSRTTNFAGILSQGLRIAPPEAPVTGYMFGKGVYFADMVSKSANYCMTSKTDNTGILLLCDVAIGDTYDLKNSEFVTKLPKGKHSTKGLGRTCPDPTQAYVTSDGITIPLGQGTDSGVTDSSLLYNEFIVYDTAQVNIRYLLKMRFNYKW